MLASPNLGTMPLDPNTQRAIEELAFVINDVEQRLQQIRMGLAQAMPAWPGAFAQGAPGFPQTPFGGVGNLQALLANPLLLQQVLATQGRFPTTGGVPGIPFGVSPFTGPTSFGSPSGVSAPFGTSSPFQAPFSPFRY